MCHQITYKLPCEHIRADTVYCADAPMLDTVATGTHTSRSGYSSGHSSSSSKNKKDGGKKHRDPTIAKEAKTRININNIINNNNHNDNDYRSAPVKRRPCGNLTRQSIAYPRPPSFEGDPSSAALSPLLPKCPLPRCPFEVRNRCWNCCWCGKGWNEQGRCSCIMLIEGNQVRCEHICCETCTTAGVM